MAAEEAKDEVLVQAAQECGDVMDAFSGYLSFPMFSTMFCMVENRQLYTLKKVP